VGTTPCTTWATEVLVAKVLGLGLYTAVKLLRPGGTPGLVKLAMPLVRGTLTSIMAPLKKVTVPVGVGPPAAGGTVAGSVTGWAGRADVADTTRVVVVGSTPSTVVGVAVVLVVNTLLSGS